MSEKMFLGGTDKAMSGAAAAWLAKEIPVKTVIPCAGAFQLIHRACSIVKPETVFASDIGLYSSVIGTVASGRSVQSLNLTPQLWLAVDERTGQAVVDEIATGKPEAIIWALRIMQLDGKGSYHHARQQDWVLNRARYLPILAAQIKTITDRLKGINYEVADMRDVIAKEKDTEAAIILNPPAYAAGYAKMFKAESLLGWSLGSREFNLEKEWPQMIESLDRPNGKSICVLSTTLRGVMDEAAYPWKARTIFSEERPNNKEPLAWLQYGGLRRIGCKTVKMKPQPKFAVWRDSDGIKSTDIVKCYRADKDTALYYRDLMVHKLKGTGAQNHILFTLNGKVWGRCWVQPIESCKASNGRGLRDVCGLRPNGSHPPGHPSHDALYLLGGNGRHPESLHRPESDVGHRRD